MYCQNRISYRVQEGDTLYKLSRQFHTTVTELILLNSGVNPYNLREGMRLTICPGEGYEPPEENGPVVIPIPLPGVRPGETPSAGDNHPSGNTPSNGSNRPSGSNPPTGSNRPSGSSPSTGNNRPSGNNPPIGAIIFPGSGSNSGNSNNSNSNSSNNMQGNLTDFRENMRLAWLTHITLVKFYLTSFFENLSSQNAWKAAVRKNADDILNIFASYYPASAMQRFRNLFQQHLALTDKVAAELQKDRTYSGEAMENWYINAEELASFLSRQTPAYNEEELRKMLYDHLDMERQQMEAYLDGEYVTDIATYLKSQQNILELADFLATGLLAR